MKKSSTNFLPNRPPHRRGFLYLELLAHIALLLVVAALATRVGLDLQRAWQRADRDDQTLRVLDWITPRLRQDVWRAASLHADASTLILTDPDGQQIRWLASPDGTLRRESSGQSTLWRPISPGVASTATTFIPVVVPTATFTADVFTVTLDLRGWPEHTPFAPTGHIQRRFISQLILANSNPPGAP
jgi:hypothetical protein